MSKMSQYLQSESSNQIFCFTVNNLSAGNAQIVNFGRLTRVLSYSASFVGNNAAVGEISSFTINLVGDIRPSITGVTAMGRIFHQFNNRLATGNEMNDNYFEGQLGVVCTGLSVKYDTAAANQNNTFNFVCQFL